MILVRRCHSMHTPARIFIRICSSLIAACLFASVVSVAFAQVSGKQMAIPEFNPPTVYTPVRLDLYTSRCPLWRTDGSFESVIRMSNQLATSPVDATVVLFMADGTSYTLPTVHLSRSGVATVNVNTAIASAPASIRSHVSSYGSASVSYRYDWQGVIYASMAM